MSDGPLPPAALLVQYQISDWDQWKSVFDGNEQARIDAGYVAHHINRAENDPNALSIYLAVGDVEKAKAYAADPSLREKMQEASVVSEPQMLWVRPAAEDAVWDREVPGVIVNHTVDDFDAWLEGYNSAEAGAMRDAAGIIGHAANQGVDNPNLALVYHQAESFDALRALVSSDTLREVMKKAGVNSEPEFTYHTGGWGKLY